MKRVEQNKPNVRHGATMERQIDALVYDLYGLTKDEIKIVEGVS